MESYEDLARSGGRTIKPNLTLDDAVRRWQALTEQGKIAAVNDLCADCPEVAADLSERLRAVASMAAFLGIASEAEPESTKAGESRQQASSLPSVEYPRDLPGYEVLGELGRGGMGVVYLARQINLDRIVALKRILTRQHATPAQLARFRNEARAVAHIRHPNIVQVHDVGEHDGLPYITFEYVRGGSLDRRLTGAPLSPAAAARFVELLSRAVQAAHERGVVHRDLKPGNVLLDDEGGGSAGLEAPKVTDFGLAKLLNSNSNLTVTDSVMGTPSYMAPEQAEGKVREVGPPADVYSLGAILYELLTGRPPFRGASVLETLQQVKSAEPVPPSRLVPGLGRDIETITLKCLEKDPSRRYTTASALADDLDHYRRDEPIAARPVGRAQRAWRWCRRNPTVAGLCAAIAASLLLGFFGSLRFAVQADVQRRSAVEARNSAESMLVEMSTRAGLTADEHGRPDEAALWFVSAAEQARHDPARRRENEARARNWLRELILPVRVLKLTGPVRSLEFHASGKYLLLLADPGPGALLWDLDEDRQVAWPTPSPAPPTAAWSPDGSTMALASVGGGVAVYRFPEWEPIDRFDDPGVVSRLEFSLDGRLLAAAGERVLVRDVTNRRHVAGPLDHPAAVKHLAFSVRGDRLATAATDGKARVFALPERPDRRGPLFPPVTHLGRFSMPENPVRPMFLDGDRTLITLLQNGRLCWRDAETGREVRTTEGERDINLFYLSPDGRTLVSGASPRVHGLEFWDVASGKLTGEIPFNGPNAVRFSDDGSVMLVGGANHSAQLWSPLTRQPLGPVMTHQAVVNEVAVSPNRSFIATAQSDGVVRVWQVPRPSARSIPLEGSYNHATITRDGKFVLPFSSDLRSGPTTAEIYEVRTGDVVARLDIGGVLHGAVFSRDGRNAITLSSATDKPLDDGYFYIPGRRPGWFRAWDWASSRPLFDSVSVPSEPVGAAYSPDGARAVVVCGGGQVLIIDPRTGAILRRSHHGSQALPEGPALQPQTFVAFAPDRQEFLTWGMGPSAVMWDVTTGQPKEQPLAHNGRCFSARYSSDGRFIATASLDDNSARVWDAKTGRLVATLKDHTDWVFHAEFSPDSRLVVTACRDRYVRVWDWRTGRLVGSPAKHSSEVKDARLLGDGDTLVSLEYERVPRIWSARTGKPLAPAHGSRIQAYQLLITPDDDWAIATGFRPWMNVVSLSRGGANEEAGLPRRRILAELVSGHALNPGGGSASGTSQSGSDEIIDKMKSADWLARWDSLTAGRDPRSGPDGGRLDFAGDPAELAHASGDNFAELGRWDLAAAGFSHASERRPDDLNIQQHYAETLLAAGDLPAFRRICVKVIAQFGATRDARIANDVASLCVLLPDALPDYGPCLRLAELAASGGRGYLEQNTLGTALYRVGRYEEAIAQLTKAAKSHGAGGTPYDWLFLAMAHQKSGRSQEARRQFSRAKEWLERASRGEQSYDPYLGSRLSWTQWTELRHLLQEAQARLRD